MPFCFGALGENKQALYTDVGGETSTVAGPGFHTWSWCTTMETRDAVVLEEHDFVRVMNNANGTR